MMVRTRAESSIMDKVPPELMSYLDQRFNQLLSSLAEKKDINRLQHDVKSLLKKIDDQQTEISSLEAKLEKQARGAFHSKKSRTPLAKILLFGRKIHQKSVKILLF